MNTLSILRKMKRYILPRAIRKMVWAAVLSGLPVMASAEDYNFLQVVTNCCTEYIARTDVRRLTFADGNLVVTKADGTDVNFGLAVLSTIAFTSGTNGVRAVDNTDSGRLLLQGERLVANDAGMLFIYDSLGRLIRQEYVGTNRSEINISGLARGLYIARLGRQTLKFIR